MVFRITKRWLAAWMSVLLLMSGVLVTPSVAPTEAQAVAPTVNIGDHIQFGKYNDTPILWRVIHKDANGDPILLSDRVLTLKPFDAKGSYHTGVNARVNDGSNYYPDSNIRQWLNSDSQNNGASTIDWIQNDPNALNSAEFLNSYNTEKGFLANGNFRAAERDLIKPFTHKVVIAGVDASKKDGGNANYWSPMDIDYVVGNYDSSAYFKNVTDSIFLLSVKQLKEWVYDNSSALGNQYIFAKPTPQAVLQSTFHNLMEFDSNTQVPYWLNTPSTYSSANVFNVDGELPEPFRTGQAIEGENGVRPALHLNLSSAIFASGGTGTSNNPFVVSGSSTAPSDTTAPTAPSGLTASSVSDSSLTLDWYESTDNEGVIAYEVYSDATLLATVTASGGSAPSTTYNVSGLMAGTSYSFTVKAKDAVGNLSTASDQLTVKTSLGTITTVSIGDYIQFGKYNDAPILWRVIHKDANGDPILLSDKILTLKAFDAKGTYHNGISSRVNYGSNYYKDSNIRQWLNSSSANSGANVVDWIQNDPTSTNMFSAHNAYNNEKGFLANDNFTSAERGIIKPYRHKVLLTGADVSKKDGGTEYHFQISYGDINGVVQRYDSAYHQNLTDSVFLLSIKQWKEWLYDNSAVLGNNYHLAKPTEQAVTQSTYKHANLNSNSNWPYRLNTPMVGALDVTLVRDGDGLLHGASANSSFGVRPAMQLNISSIFALSGAGTSGDPLIIEKAPNLAPIDIKLSEDTITENSNPGTTIGTLSATDVNEGESFTYSLLSAEEQEKTDNESFTIDENVLKADEVFDYDLQSIYTIAVRVTDSGGLSYDETMTITVTEAKVKLSKDNKKITMTFKENIVNAATANPAVALKAAFTIATNANVATPTYNPLGSNDKILIFKNKLIVTFQNALESQNIKVKLAENALRDIVGNKSVEIISDTFAADKSGPTISKVTVSSKNKIITVKFNESVLNGSSLAKAPDQLVALKNAITIATNADAATPTYSALGATDKVSIVKGKLVITLTTELKGANNKIKLAADALKDAANNKSAEALSSMFSADLTGPTLVGINVNANKEITLKFNENVAMFSTAIAFKNAITLATNGNLPTPTYSALAGTDKLTLNKNTVMITRTAALSGTSNKIQIAADALRDQAGNKNTLMTTSIIIADSTGPKIASASKMSEKVIAIKFNETATINSTATKDPEKLTALKAKISLAANGNAGTPTYSPLGSGDSITYTKGVLTITLGTALSGASNKLKIASGAMKDSAGNENADTTTTLIAADTSGPTLSKTTIDAMNKIVILTFNEKLVNGAAGATDALKLTALKSAITVAANGTNFSSLGSKDKILLKENTLVITFATALSGSTNVVKITTANLKDALSNNAGAITTSAIVADGTGPELK